MNEPLDDLLKRCKKRLLFDKPRGLRTMLKDETHSKRLMIRRICGDVAQLGERSVRNAEVVGSIPIISTSKFINGRFYLPFFIALPAYLINEVAFHCPLKDFDEE